MKKYLLLRVTFRISVSTSLMRCATLKLYLAIDIAIATSVLVVDKLLDEARAYNDIIRS